MIKGLSLILLASCLCSQAATLSNVSSNTFVGFTNRVNNLVDGRFGKATNGFTTNSFVGFGATGTNYEYKLLSVAGLGLKLSFSGTDVVISSTNLTSTGVAISGAVPFYNNSTNLGPSSVSISSLTNLVVGGNLASYAASTGILTVTNQIIIQGITRASRDALTPIDGMIIRQTDSTPGPRIYVSGAWYLLNITADP